MVGARRKNIVNRITTLGVALTVSVLCIGVGANFWLAARQSKAQLETKLDEQLQQAGSALQNPLWSYDLETTKLICDASMSGTDAARLEVLQKTRDGWAEVYRMDKSGTDDLVSGEIEVTHRGEVIGLVRISLSEDRRTQWLSQLLVMSGLLILIVVAASYFTMRILLRRHLATPLRMLGEWTERVALGEYGGEPSRVEDAELRPIIDKFSEMSRKVSERETSLRKSEKRFREMADLLPALLFEVEPSGVIRFVNQAAMTALKLEPEAIRRGVNVIDLVAEEDRERFKGRMAELSAEAPQDGGEYKARATDGTTFTILAYASPIREGERTVGLRAVALDISRQRALENHLAQSSKLEAIGTLAGGIAHDFNNILRAIIGYSELSLNDGNLQEEDRHNIEAVYTAGERAKELVKQILVFSRRDTATDEPVLIHEIVGEALNLVRKTIPATVRIEREIDEATGYVLADPTHIHQIVMNLCTNAFHAVMDVGGAIGVTLRRLHADEAMCARHPAMRLGPYAELVIRDNGIGMSPELIEKIFDPFFTTKEAGKGTGMGLSMVHGIVTRQGGAIEVESEPGRGTTFLVYLPIVEFESLESRADPSPFPRGRGERILIVDDDPQLAVLGRRMLVALGYEAVSATRSLAALEMLRGDPHAFDVVVTDQNMPELSGIDLVRRIHEIRPDMPVVLCTGHSDAVDADSARRLGVHTFLMKPVSMQKLADVIHWIVKGDDSER